MFQPRSQKPSRGSAGEPGNFNEHRNISCYRPIISRQFDANIERTVKRGVNSAEPERERRKAARMEHKIERTGAEGPG